MTTASHTLPGAPPASLESPTPRAYRICTRCVMDTTDPEIQFDEAGHCNHCRGYDLRAREVLRPPERRDAELRRVVAEMREAGRNSRYDCVIGVSGGVDSTYVAYLTRQLGLRPLAVHMDNGWNSELAVRNIERMLTRLEIDLHTHVLDWEEFRGLQVAFLRASVPDLEIPTDHALAAVIYRTAIEHGIPFVISGSNMATEGIMATSWVYGVGDWRYIRGVNDRHGSGPLRTYPHYGLTGRLYYSTLRRIRTVRLLDLVPYVTDDVLSLLTNELGWQYYGGKHYESIYTRFVQGHILPRKFDIDKRRAHLSTLICSGQRTREAALAELERHPYEEKLQAEDREYVLKRLGFDEAGFEGIMRLPIRSSADFPTYRPVLDQLRRVARAGRVGRVVRRAGAAGI
jgi:N-acetyl sugar amidotransferase